MCPFEHRPNVETLSFHWFFEPNWKNESPEDLSRIKIYLGRVFDRKRPSGETIMDDADSLCGIPFGKMGALEAVAILDVKVDCKGSFASLLLNPSLKVLQMRVKFPPHGSVGVMDFVDRIEKDVAGRRMDQVETLVLQSWERTNFLENLDKLLALFPNLKSLRLDSYVMTGSVSWDQKGIGKLGVDLGRLVRKKLRH
jgi:hypothetical protein